MLFRQIYLALCTNKQSMILVRCEDISQKFVFSKHRVTNGILKTFFILYKLKFRQIIVNYARFRVIKIINARIISDNILCKIMRNVQCRIIVMTRISPISIKKLHLINSEKALLNSHFKAIICFCCNVGVTIFFFAYSFCIIFIQYLQFILNNLLTSN